MYTTVIHPLRRHLHLSLVEYCVLDSIYHLQNKEKYDFWCIVSHSYIADYLDVSEKTVSRAYKALLERSYIKEGGLFQGKTKRVRLEQNICDLLNHHKRVKGLAFDEEFSIELLGQNVRGQEITPDKMSEDPGQNVLGTPDKMSDNIYSNINNNTLTKVKGAYGSTEVNQIIEIFKKHTGGLVDGSIKEQRQYGKLLWDKIKLGTNPESKSSPAEVLHILIQVLGDDPYYGHNFCSPKKTYYKIGELMQRARLKLNEGNNSHINNY